MSTVSIGGLGALNVPNWEITPAENTKIQELRKPKSKPTGELTLVYYLNRRDGIEKIRNGEFSSSRVLNPLSDYNYDRIPKSNLPNSLAQEPHFDVKA